MEKVLNLAEDGAASVYVYVEEGLLTIGDYAFSKGESAKIRDFISEWITDGD